MSLPVVDTPGVEQHGAAAQCREVMLDQEFFDAGVLRQDLVQQLAQARDVPLAVAQIVEECADRFARRDAERAVEGAIGAFDMQLSIEHQQRLAHGVDHVLGQLARVLGGLFTALKCCRCPPAPAPRRPPCCRASCRGARAANTSGRLYPAPRVPARAVRR